MIFRTQVKLLWNKSLPYRWNIRSGNENIG